MKLWTMLALWWRIWLDAPSCSGNCGQGAKPCDCQRSKE
jgi:hypothetical protein